MGKKVTILGIDGGTWKVLTPLIKEGFLPTLAQLLDKGHGGTLISTVPPVTAPAWSTFQTGVSPLKHGIIDFFSFKKTDRSYRLINSSSLKYPTIWKLASKAGLKVAIINVPVTYPPSKINGYVIAGLLTPDTKCNFTYPSSLKDYIFEKHGKYTIFVGHDVLKRKGFDKFLKELIEVESVRTEVALDILEREDWNLFMLHNQSSDALQHAVWPFIDHENENFDQNMFEICAEFYRSMDENINRILQKVGDSAVIVMSDHGFGPLNKVFNINRWLIEQGFIKTKKSYIKSMEELVRKLDKLKLARRVIPVRKREKIRKSLDLDFYLEWDKTKAFVPYGSLYACLFVNSCDQNEIESILEDLSEKARRVIDPDTGANVIKKVWRIEELSDDVSYLKEDLPDAIIEPNQGYSFNSSMIRENLFSVPSFRMGALGRHETEGIVIFSSDIATLLPEKWNGKIYIGSLAPIILSYLGVDPPFYMDI